MRAVISVIGKDTVGILAKVASICADNNINIVDVTQSVLQDMFVMVMMTEIDKMSCSLSEISKTLAKLGESMNLDIRVMHEDIFNSMHRI
ncbi:MAG: ACT domain-containing protein [Clostridia bacterium]|nr:ACT domain-containing protein [Clostridia bacterium]